MSYIISRIVIIFILTAFLSSCRTAATFETATLPPDWLIREPRISGMVCAVGASEPTYYREDAKRYAAENARKELARAISVDIDSIMIEVATDTGNSVDEATVMQASSWATSTVVENSQIIEYWYDAEGAVANKSITYALACMPDNYLIKK